MVFGIQWVFVVVCVGVAFVECSLLCFPYLTRVACCVLLFVGCCCLCVVGFGVCDCYCFVLRG